MDLVEVTGFQTVTIISNLIFISVYEWFWLIQVKFFEKSVQNLNFYISSFILYIVDKYKRRLIYIILRHYIKILSDKSCCLINFKYSKIKNIANLPYKKFRTNFPCFNQNISYSI
jgi:hypothetical protein